MTATATAQKDPGKPSPVVERTNRLPDEAAKRGWGSFFLFFFTFVILSSIAVHLRYALPEPGRVPDPLPSDGNISSASLHFSEALANQYIYHLADTIGYRIVGTEEMEESLNYLLGVLKKLKSEAKAFGSTKQFEIFHQKDDGAQLFDFMGKKVWKKYHQLSNIIVQLSDPSEPRSRENAVLVNAHLDSTLPSPGAADDLVGVAVMLEAIRIITRSPNWKMYNGIVFLFNGAEESLQDASHMFITKHPLKDIVRAVINLEACGTTGQEILFQATSQEMIEAYSKVPRPFGSIAATEVFKTGLIASDTDFRQFVQYGNLTGLDLALMQNSYLYHTSQDVPSKIERGAVQHMGENMMALLKHLSSASADLTDVKPALTTVFFSSLGGHIFVMYSKVNAIRVYMAMSSIAVSLIARNIKRSHYKLYFWACVTVLGSLFFSVLASNVVSFFIATLWRKPLSWYRRETFPILLFGPPSLAAALFVQLAFSTIAKKTFNIPPRDRYVLSHATIFGLLLFYGSMSVAGAWLGIGAAYIPALGLGSLTAALLLNDLLVSPLIGESRHLHLSFFLIGLIIPSLVGVEGLLSFLDLFVPLTGRMGHEVAADPMIATLVSVLGFNVLMVVIPFAHQFSTRNLGRLILFFSMFSAVILCIFARDSWESFDADHPRRLAILHMENLTTTPPTFSLHVARMDSAPGFETLVKNISSSVSLEEKALAVNAITDDIPDWDIIYPVSQFLKSYRIPLTSKDHHLVARDLGAFVPYQSPWKRLFRVRTLRNKLDYMKQQRTISIAIDHPGIIWPVIAFTADVVSWDLPEPPERGLVRHHIKEASAFGVDRWNLTVTIALTEAEFDIALRHEQIKKGQRPSISANDKDALEEHRRGLLRIDYSGLDQLGLFPARSKQKRFALKQQDQDDLKWIGHGDGGPGMKLFESLKSRLPDWVDPFHLSVISNVAYV